GSASGQAGTTRCRTGGARGTKIGPGITAVLTTQNPAHRSNYIPVRFTPRQNPFYCALPYNDKSVNGHRPEAPRVVPWFKESYQGPGVSTCKDRWVAIRKGNRDPSILEGGNARALVRDRKSTRLNSSH